MDDKYVEVDDKESRPFYEQRKWEEDQMRGTALSFGARDKDKKYKETTKEYHLILEDEIEFIKSLPLEGTRKKKRKKKKKRSKGDTSSADSEEEEKPKSEAQVKQQSLDEVRRSLPVYPFRSALLEAVQEHQVRVLGSNFYVLLSIGNVLEWEEGVWMKCLLLGRCVKSIQHI